MGFDVDLNAGSSTFESVEAEKLVGNELKIARGLEGNEFAKKDNDRSGQEPRWSPPLVLM
jgi:hypothetical protein